MKKHQLRFLFEHGGHCMWGMNDKAKKKYGYAIENSRLPISNELIDKLDLLQKEYSTSLDWDNPLNPSPWTEEHKKDFYERAEKVYEELKRELGSKFQITNEVYDSIG